MLNISALRLQLAEDGVQATSIARAELTTRVAEYKSLGDQARVIVFGSHRKAQAAIVPIELFEELLDLAQGVPHVPKSEQPKKQGKKQIVQNEAESETPKVEADHVGASTQELLDQIMSKWNI